MILLLVALISFQSVFVYGAETAPPKGEAIATTSESSGTPFDECIRDICGFVPKEVTSQAAIPQFSPKMDEQVAIAKAELKQMFQRLREAQAKLRESPLFDPSKESNQEKSISPQTMKMANQLLLLINLSRSYSLEKIGDFENIDLSLYESPEEKAKAVDAVRKVRKILLEKHKLDLFSTPAAFLEAKYPKLERREAMLKYLDDLDQIRDRFEKDPAKAGFLVAAGTTPTFRIRSLVEKGDLPSAEVEEFIRSANQRLVFEAIGDLPEGEIPSLSKEKIDEIASSHRLYQQGKGTDQSARDAVLNYEIELANLEISEEKCLESLEFGMRQYPSEDDIERLKRSKEKTKKSFPEYLRRGLSKESAESLVEEFGKKELVSLPPTPAEIKAMVLGGVEDEVQQTYATANAAKVLTSLDNVNWQTLRAIADFNSITGYGNSLKSLREIDRDLKGGPTALKEKVRNWVRENGAEFSGRCERTVNASAQFFDSNSHSGSFFEEVKLSRSTAKADSETQEAIISHEYGHWLLRRFQGDQGKPLSQKTRGEFYDTILCLKGNHRTETRSFAFDPQKDYLKEDFADLMPNEFLKNSQTNWACHLFTLPGGTTGLSDGLVNSKNLNHKPGDSVSPWSSNLFRLLAAERFRANPRLDSCRRALARIGQQLPSNKCLPPGIKEK